MRSTASTACQPREQRSPGRGAARAPHSLRVRVRLACERARARARAQGRARARVRGHERVRDARHRRDARPPPPQPPRLGPMRAGNASHITPLTPTWHTPPCFHAQGPQVPSGEAVEQKWIEIYL